MKKTWSLDQVFFLLSLLMAETGSDGSGSILKVGSSCFRGDDFFMRDVVQLGQEKQIIIFQQPADTMAQTINFRGF